jgi:hypothetical protein
MGKHSNLILKILHIVAWIIFIGLCIQAGGFLFNSIFILFINPEGAHKLWTGVDLSGLLAFDQSHFVTISSLMIIVAVLKALLFYFILKILHDKKLDLQDPFQQGIERFFFLTSYTAFGIGIFSLWGMRTSDWLETQQVQMPSLFRMGLDGMDAWFLVGVILYVFAQIFKKGVEIKNENDLTV